AGAPPPLRTAGAARPLHRPPPGGAAGPPSTRQLPPPEEAAPVFQYAGKAPPRKDRVFVWGFSYSGALGVPSFVKPDAGWTPPRRIQPTPYRLETDPPLGPSGGAAISSAACGYGPPPLASNTTDITKVWAPPLNKDSQLGFQRSSPPQTKGYPPLLEPSPIPLPLEKPPPTRVLQVSCGRAHSLILTDSEGAPPMGNNSYGQCGRKVIEDEIYSDPPLIHQLKEFDSRVVVCGQDPPLFRTKKGSVYACGPPPDGQTGLGHYNITSVPTKLHGDIAGVNIVQVSSYGDCCLAVSDEGDVFGWGNSEYLQLASVTETTQPPPPRHLPFKIGKIKAPPCGGTGNAVLTEEGNIFVWGYGIPPPGPNLIETAVPEMTPPSLFGWSDFNSDICPPHIRCGLSQFAAVTPPPLIPLGELFVWGKNLPPPLGTGRMEDQYFP
ncbi:RCC1L protein, partial [Tachuris rubrigastra]|nr:RCC1L protein [Tachuris rubrigastra]